MNLNLPFADYLAAPGISSSSVRQYIRSPSHYRHYLETGGEPPTPAQLVGTLIHCAVLEPGSWHARYVIAPAVDRRTKDGKQAWATFAAANKNREIVSADQHETAWTIADRLSEMPEFRRLKFSGINSAVEASAFAIDPESGLQTKARADFVRADGVLMDLKSAADASPHGFASACARYGYHIQAAFYLDTFNADPADGPQYDRFCFVAVEKAAPYAAGVYWLDEASIELGRQQYRKALLEIAQHQRNDTWPVGYGEQEISLPAWAFWENEEEVTL